MPQSYSQSAVRHFRDAEHLAAAESLNGARYLIGYAAECAIKAAVEATRPAAEAPHIHLPELVERAKKALHGRRQQAILAVLKKADFMAGWTTGLRYEADQMIEQEQYQAWRTDALRIMGAAGLRRESK